MKKHYNAGKNNFMYREYWKKELRELVNVAI